MCLFDVVVNIVLTFLAGLLIGCGFYEAGYSLEKMKGVVVVSFSVCGVISALFAFLAVMPSPASVDSAGDLADLMLSSIYSLFYFLGFLVVGGFFGVIGAIASFVVMNVVTAIQKQGEWSGYL